MKSMFNFPQKNTQQGNESDRQKFHMFFSLGGDTKQPADKKEKRDLYGFPLLNQSQFYKHNLKR